MRGTSRASLSAVKLRLDDALPGGSAAQWSQLGDELFEVASLLDREPGLRRALSDPSRGSAARSGLAVALLGGKISAEALDQVSGLVAERWSAPADLADASEELAVIAMAKAADAEGSLDETEDELFRFGRIVAGNPGLRSALSNQFAPAAARQAVVTDLLAGKVGDAALRLITRAAGYPRRRSLDASLDLYARLAAELRERLVAEVRVARPLTDAQRDRLAASLAAAYGRRVHVNVVLDPEVIGGMSVRIGDQLINGTAVSRLADLRRRLSA